MNLDTSKKKRGDVIINLSPVKSRKPLNDENDETLKEAYERISFSKLNLLSKQRNLELKKILIKVFNFIIFISTIIIQIIQAVMYSSFVSPQSLSAAKFFNISSICLTSIGMAAEAIVFLQAYDDKIKLYIQTVNQYDKLLNKIEKISHTKEENRKPDKIERLKNTYTDLQTILNLS